MTVQELKNSILQLAIQGRLVEQREEEGTAKKLIEQIKAEKEQLIKDKKIKKEKPQPEITQEEIPFDIPDSWEWIYLDQVAVINGGFAFKSSNYTQTGVRVIRISDFNERGFVNDKIVRHSYDESLSMYLLEIKDILLCMTGGTVGKSYFIKEVDEPMMTNQRVATIKVSKKVIPEYINFTILSPIIQSIIKASKNSTNDNISMNTIKTFPIPLPPLEEQKRIVAKIQELVPYVEQYDKAYTKLETLNKKFPEDMQKSILQYAIQGKLVEQRAEEGTAEELYQQIQEEKVRLIKEGKIKKEKPLPEITEDEIPFDIPEAWKWVRIGNLAWYLDAGKSPNCIKENVKNDEWGVITTTAIQTNYFDQYQNKTLPKDFIIKPEMQVKVGDVLITRAGPTNRTGVACFVADLKYNLILSDKIVRINLSNDYINKEFITLVINSPKIRKFIIKLMSGMDKQQVNISQDKIKNIIIPLPPLGEQKRIVAKIEEMLPYCQQLIK